MTLTIELSPDLERRLAEEAARRGQAAEQFARAVLEERLAPLGEGEPDRHAERTSKQILDDFFARFPPSTPEELRELAHQQGVHPFPGFEQLLGEGPQGEDDFDVDAFLGARKQWQWEGRPPGVGLADPEDRHQSVYRRPRRPCRR
jgi:plasmid stability protein